MDNLCCSFKIKKGKNVNIKKNKQQLIITNNDNQIAFVIFTKPLILKNNSIIFHSDVEVKNGEECEFKLLNPKLKVRSTFHINEEIIETETSKISFLGLKIYPNSKIVINNAKIDFITEKEKDEKIKNYFKGNILLICPGYPSNNDKYNCAFIHTRVKEYKNLKMNIDIAHVNDLFNFKTEFSSFEGIDVIRTGFNDIRKVLRKKHYDKILIHFFNERHAQIFDSLNISDTQLYFYLHGAETLYWDWQKMTTGYFKPFRRLTDAEENLFKLRDRIIKKYNNLPNVHWMFVTPWTKQRSEELIGIKYNNANIIPCFVDNKIFNYQQKDPELRKKIFVIRPFKDIATYGTDIDVKVILELSRRPLFNDLEFDIYGAGDMFDIITKPLRKFENVHLHNKFLSHKEISEMHKQHGIALIATRYDSQAISCCEAALSGCVVVSTDNPGIKQEIYPKYNTLCNQENYKEYADVIERLYNNPDEFMNISKSMSEDVNNLYNYENTIGKELDIFKNEKTKKISFDFSKIENKNPLLTVLIPAYNVEEYLDHTIFSLINQKYANLIEVLIVNDGSKDKTLDICKKWEKLTKTKNSSIVRVIDKENGGHGSVINVGIKEARGKYFRILDGDDTFDSEQFARFLELLKNEETDLILTDLVNDYAPTNTTYYNDFYSNLIEGLEYNFNDLCYEKYGFGVWGPVLSTSTYKTEKIRAEEFKVTEKMPYDDMEYNFFVIKNIDTVKYYKLFIYNYLLGRPGQTVSDASLKSKCDKHEVITLNLIRYYNELKNISDEKKNYLKNSIVLNMICSHYLICCNYYKTGIKFRKFDKKLKQYPQLYKEVLDYCSKSVTISRRRIKLLRLSNGFLNLPFYIIRKLKK